MSETTTAIRLHQTGGPEVLAYEQIPMPEPGPGEIRLRVEAIGVGYGECLYRMGNYIQETRLPSSLGNHAVGTVEAVGPDVEEPKIGQRISVIPSFQMNRYGVYAQHAIVPATAWAPYFPELSLQDNASIWMQATTAYGALVHYGQVAPGDVVLVTPASGGVGMAALQTAKQAGAITIGTTRHQTKRDAVLQAGADHVVATEEESLTERVQEITNGRGARLIFNALSGTVIDDLAQAVSPGGTIFMYGAIGTQPTVLPLLAVIERGVRLKGYNLYELTYDAANLPAIRRHVADAVRGGHFTPIVGRVFGFDEMAEAHRYLEAGNMSGSVVVLFD